MARRLADRLAAVAALVLAMVWTAAPANAVAPKRICEPAGDRLAELSGLASDGRRWYAVNDGGTRIEVVVLDRKCREQRTITAAIDPFDVEDLARDGDGTLWLADTGDNGKQRDTVALLRVTPDGTASLHRLTYPDGQHDAEALLLDGSGRPYIVTKNVLGQSEVYRPTGTLRSPGPTPLAKVAEVNLAATDTPGGPAGTTGSVLVTGGAVSHDGKVVALRTYTDAYLYPAADGDVVRALSREPVRIPLPGEEQGEAIAFEPDGTLLSGSEGSGQPIRAVRAAAARVAPAAPDDGSAAVAAPAEADAERGTGMPMLPGLVVAVVVVGAVWFGFSRLRRFRR